MSRETNQQIAAGFAQGLQNFVQGYTQRKAAEKEQSRVRDLMARLQSASDVEKVGIYGQIDPKLALQFEMNQEKNKLKQQQQQMIMNEYRNLAEAPQGGDQGQKTQIVDPQGSDVQPGYSVSGPSMAARNQTMPNFPGNKNFMQEPVVAAPQVNAAPIATQEQQVPQQQLTPRQQAQSLRAKAGYLNSLQPGAGAPLLAEAKAIETELKDSRKAVASERDFAYKTNADVREEMSALSNAIPRTEMLLDMAESAIASGEVGALSLANIAKRTGIRELNTAEGAQLEAAIKGQLFTNLGKIKAKGINMFLEKVALSSYAQIGESAENNLIKTQLARSELELSKAEYEGYKKQLEEDINQFGQEQPYLKMRAEKYIIPVQKEIAAKNSYKIQKLKEQQAGFEGMSNKWNRKVTQGTPLTPEMGKVLMRKIGNPIKMIETAKELGYTIPSKEQIQSYEQ